MLKKPMIAIATAFALSAAIAWGHDGVGREKAMARAEQTGSSSERAGLTVGDKLKVSFYDIIDLAAPKPDGADPQGALRTFYQRMDLSGEYTIEQDGAISIPLLGRFQIEGQSLDDVRTDLAASFTAVMGRGANIDVKLLERPPIYVVGAVKNPGAYKYVPGMIVLHAIALAGGLDKGDGSLAGVIEGARQTERLRTTSLQLEQLLARRARLEAQRDGVSTLPLPVQLVQLAGENDARTFVATEMTILRAEQARRLQAAKEIELKVAAARTEVQGIKRKLDQIDVEVEMRSTRLNDVQKLKDRGLMASSTVVALRAELSDIEARRHDAVITLAHSESSLAEAEDANERLSLETSEKLATALASADHEIAAAEEAMTSAKALAAALYRPAGGAHSYEIVRQAKDGATTLRAMETSPLLPGDVLKINSEPAEMKPAMVAPVPRPQLVLPYLQAAAEQKP